ncbi:3-hydroxyisobutyrate dehydrogenase-like beta-hydroxyacid dehydrogenase [Kribbella pratensis]|uniref:3-hydroxyisobutyrate dehydrogenase-like beta-hydroxyacid dehydrogenase n=1 Tax=Kribbella pratensis TaxID=2512112 RepID=A0ABY2FQ30_9ACTN|nr:NAD(P)-dependent oxidoreductase [Kribbella pratensis]TDW95255.1 3-hydroxyisobutyrate dehydrogenase-like beta-hydroxyacid dehydrogenase [Kribbella pratensis]
MSDNKPTVGFIGFGDQGAPIAQAIADGGYPLHVWARRPESLMALEGHAFTTHSSVSELAAVSDIVGLCLREDSDNLQVAVEGRLLENMRRGAVLVNHGTGLPQAARELARLAEPYGVEVLDAPVSGGRAVALARQLTTIVGGRTQVVERLTPVFRTFSKEVIHVGPARSGQYGKLFNNALMMMNHQNVIEVLDLARSLELPTRPLLDVLRSGSATSFALQAIGPSITSENVHHLQPLELLDMQLFSGAVDALGNQARTVVERAIDGARRLDELTAVVGA